MIKQLQQLKKKPRIIVGTPGRINDHLRQRTLKLDETDFLVLDETDRMLDMGFGAQLEQIAKYLPAARQTLMFSATLPANIISLSRKYLNNPVRIAVGATTAPAANIRQELIKTTDAAKYGELINQLQNREGSVLVFVKTKYGAERLAQKLAKENQAADAIHGDLRQSRREKVIAGFRQRKFRVLVATDIAARGLDIPHIESVINYDLPYNTLTLEQRINRCHRQGQQSDVIILNFLNRNNFADVRTLELINKRILQFSGIFGMSDTVIGNFSNDSEGNFSNMLAKARTRQEIEQTHQSTLERFEAQNKELVSRAEHSLFTSFTRDIAEKVYITPRYIEAKTKEIEDDLWYVTRWFFAGKQGFRLDDATRTVTVTHLPPPKVFTGKALRRMEYGMAKDYQPRSGRHTVTGSLARGIFGEMFWRGIPESGSLVVDADIEPCELALYEVRVRPKGNFWGGYAFYPLTGETRSGRVLSHDECAALMALPVRDFSVRGEPVGKRNRHLRPAVEHKLDRLISGDDFIRKVLTETDSAEKEAVNALKNRAAERKVELMRRLEGLRFQVKTARAALDKELSRMERLSLQRRCSRLTAELRRAEQQLSAQHRQLDTELEEHIQELLADAQLAATMERLFVVQVSGTA